MQRNKMRRVLRRQLRLEPLESRSMLAGLVGDSPFQNPLDPTDLNCDGSVTPLDALVAINALNSGASGEMSSHWAPTMLHDRVQGAAADFLDASGDGVLTPLDPLLVINKLNSRHHGDSSDDLPVEDQQSGVPGADAQVIDVTHGFARVKAAINTDGDVDVFQVKPTKEELNVALFSSASGAMTVTVLQVADDGTRTDLSTASTEAGSHAPAKLDVDVTPGATYFIEVKADAGVTGTYGLGVLNYGKQQFTPTTDAELGDDIHGNTKDTATLLTLNRGHAEVRSNIDPAADGDTAGDVDFFKINTTAGKLIVEGGAAFPITVQVTDGAGVVLGTFTSPEGHVTVTDVPTGAVYVSVTAANGTDTGAYRLNIVNAPLEKPEPPHVPTADELFAKIDTNGDQLVTLDEFKAGVPFGHSTLADRIFAAWDTDGTPGLTAEEFATGFATLQLPPPRHDHRGDHHGEGDDHDD